MRRIVIVLFAMLLFCTVSALAEQNENKPSGVVVLGKVGDVVIDKCAVTLEDLIKKTEPEETDKVDGDDTKGRVEGNLLETIGIYYLSAQDVNMRSFITCDKAMFVVGEPSVMCSHTTGGTKPYTYTWQPYFKNADAEVDVLYRSYNVRGYEANYTLTPPDTYHWLIYLSVYDAMGNYVKCYVKYDTVDPESLDDITTLGGKIKYVVATETNDSMTDYEKALALHDWLIYNAAYDTTLQIHNPEGVMLQGKGVCESYANAFQMMMSEIGIPCISVTGGDHAWNMIYIWGGWYHVDVTWDDPVIGQGEQKIVSGAERHTFFVVTDDVMRESGHIWSVYDDEGQIVPPSGPGPLYPEMNEEETTGITWSISNGVLTFSGEGIITINDENALHPKWYDPSVTSIVVENGITGLDNSVFKGFANVTSISLPETLQTVGDEVFYGCNSLTSITIPKSVKTIGDRIFVGCNGLERISVPFVGKTRNDGILLGEWFGWDGEMRFEDFTPDQTEFVPGTLHTIDITNASSIGDDCFINCDQIQQVILHKGLKQIRSNAFYNCTSLTGISIPEGVQSIYYDAFAYTGITKTYIPDSIINLGVGGNPWTGCENLTDIYIENLESYLHALPEGTTTSGSPMAANSRAHNLYINGEKVTRIVIPEGIQRIGNSAFALCNSLLQIILPEGIQSIGSCAFTSNAKIYMPNSLTTFGNGYSSQTVIYCHEHSAADVWATANGLEVVYVDGDNFADFGSVQVKVFGNQLASIKKGDTLQLIAEVFPEADSKVAWESADTTIATVDENGLVTAIENGIVQISATVRGVTGTIEIEVLEHYISELAMIDAPEAIRVGDSIQLRYQTIPVVEGLTAVWTSSDENVLQVSENGVVTGVSKGVAVITVMVEGEQASAEIRVATFAQSITLPEETWAVAQTNKQLELTVYPPDAEMALEWISEADAYGQVIDEVAGIVACYAPGDTIIRVVDRLSGLTAQTTLHVVTPVMFVWMPDDYTVESCLLTAVRIQALAVTTNGVVVNNQLVQFSSDAPEVADVDQNGLVTIKRNGIATITATADSGASDSMVITVAEAGWHVNKIYHEAVDGDCTKNGRAAYYYCEDCGRYLDEELNLTEKNSWILPNKHLNTELVDAVEATCYEAGNIVYYVCADCGVFCDGNGVQLPEGSWIIPAIEHANMVHRQGVFCTAEADATYFVCPDCGNFFDEEKNQQTQFTEASGKYHVFGEYTEAVDRTCGKDGCLPYYVCDLCNAYISNAYINEAFETGYGLMDSYRPVSAEDLIIPATGKHYARGNVCVNCGKTFDVSGMTAFTLPDGQKYVDQEQYTGTTAQVIIVPGCYQVINHRAFADSPNIQYVLIPRNTEISGNPFEGCGKVEIIYLLSCENHSEVIDEAIPPTCTETGLTEGKHCSMCNEVLLAQEVVAALGHTEVTDIAIEPTCSEKGLTEGKHCSVCNEVLVAQEEIDALGHNEVVDVAIDPTCTETGLTEGKHCSVCNEVLLAQEVVAALGHSEAVDKAVDPTCTETGLTEGKHCSVCNEVLLAQEIVAALGHTEVIDEAVEPNCTEIGLTEGKHCSVCNEVFVAQEEIAALGHTEVIDEAVEPNCTEIGLTEGKHCSACNEVLVAQEEIAALGHTEVVDKGYPATRTEEGLSDGKHCSVCGVVTVAQKVLPFRTTGDVNGDGVINGKDNMLMMQYLAGWDVDIDLEFADLNGDGVVNGKDSMLLMQYLAGWDVTLA